MWKFNTNNFRQDFHRSFGVLIIASVYVLRSQGYSPRESRPSEKLRFPSGRVRTSGIVIFSPRLRRFAGRQTVAEITFCHRNFETVKCRHDDSPPPVTFLGRIRPPHYVVCSTRFSVASDRVYYFINGQRTWKRTNTFNVLFIFNNFFFIHARAFAVK